MTDGRFEESVLGKISPILGGGNGHSTAACRQRSASTSSSQARRQELSPHVRLSGIVWVWAYMRTQE